MRRCAVLGRATSLLVLVLAVLPLAVHAAKTTSVTTVIYQVVVDEQNTSLFHNNKSCQGSSNPLSVAAGLGYTAVDVGLGGDLQRPDSGPAYNFPLWTPVSLTNSSYDEVNSCTSNGTCVVSSLVQNSTTLSLNTRSTPRSLRINLGYPCPSNVCGFDNQALPTQLQSPFQQSQAKVSISLNSNAPLTSMTPCQSVACFEAQEGHANLWFDDPVTPLLSWKVSWGRMRVLRMSLNTWYFIADACDGTSTAALYRTENRRSPFWGWYIMPFFITATK